MNYAIGAKVFDNWEIKEELGEGSYGKVFEIQKEQAGITTKAALKVMRIPKSASEVKAVMREGMDEKSVTSYFKGYVDKLKQEVAVMVALKGHPGIVSCENYELIPHAGSIGWDILIQMELLTPLEDYQQKCMMNEAEVRRLGRELCSALVFCHQKHGIIHRDIKPSNIFVSEAGQFKLGDFGVSKSMEGSAGFMSRQGTDYYMAPEVYLNKPYGESVDIYSLGLVLYRMMNGNRLPFYPAAPEMITFDKRQDALTKRMQGAKIAPPRYASEEFAEVILKACAYEPGDRYRNASEFLEALENIEIVKNEQREKRIEELPPQPTADYTSDEREDDTRGPFDRVFEREQENECEEEEGTRGIFGDLPLEEEKDEEVQKEEKTDEGNPEEKIVPPHSEHTEKKREKNKKKSGFHLKTAVISAVLVMVVGMKLISGKGKTEPEKPVNNTPVVQNEQSKEENNAVSQDEANQNLTEEEKEKWQNVYEKVYSSLKDSAYDFTNLTFEDYSEYLLQQGFVYQETLSDVRYVKEVKSCGYTTDNQIYRCWSEKDLEKMENGSIANIGQQIADIEMSVDRKTGKITYVSYEFTLEEATRDYLKGCPILVRDLRTMKDYLDEYSITQEMLQTCENRTSTDEYTLLRHADENMGVGIRFYKEAEDFTLDEVWGVFFGDIGENIKLVQIDNTGRRGGKEHFHVTIRFQ